MKPYAGSNASNGPGSRSSRQTGNPGGRPKKKPITDRYLRIVETELPDEIRAAIGLPRGATFGDAIALAQARQAIKGETAAAKEIREAIEERSMMQADFEEKNPAMTIIFDMPMPHAPSDSAARAAALRTLPLGILT
jgi:hypothetical protein